MGIILGGYNQRDGKISYHLCEIHSKDDPILVRKNRHVKKPSYAAMGSGESFALTVLSNYNANSTLLNERIVLVDAVYQGILNDCHSGGNVDICTLIP
ncbi:putative proteasome endopeptidase complex, partial [Tanacetum coccineum]